jgi:hypothetical protein
VKLLKYSGAVKVLHSSKLLLVIKSGLDMGFVCAIRTSRKTEGVFGVASEYGRYSGVVREESCDGDGTGNDEQRELETVDGMNILHMVEEVYQELWKEDSIVQSRWKY